MSILIVTRRNFCILSFLYVTYFFASTYAATFNITNSCSFVVWAAAVPGGGRKLNPGETWALDASSGTRGARIWARTGCSFDSAGRGRCNSGDCGGVLECRGYGRAPNTLAEYALNQVSNLDFFDISLVDGFNVPMEFSPTSPQCRRVMIKCAADINGPCPTELRDPGGCNNPCTVFRNDQFCCNSGNCEATSYSKFFKDRCPDAYSYPKDDQTSTFTCPSGTNYKVVFCP
ncbi:Thaumatin [Trema orientale]|uniref:Thaumatin n=1 Tax=Trema orientale TaxID=63057 RepID=A0A2P5ELN6_TREOI|nr:Thaumatin [Trema orientale]